MRHALGGMAIGRRSTLSAIGALVLIALTWPTPAEAAGGDLDPGFGVGGKVTTNFTRRADFVYPFAFQADGKIVVAGEAGCCAGNPKFALARYPDGSLDTSFSGDGKLTTDFTRGEDVPYGVVVQPDGKIVAAGAASFAKLAVARYLPDGSLDASFSGDGKLTTNFASAGSFIFAVAIRADGTIVAVGDTGGSNPQFAVARYNPDGSPDTSFGGDGEVTTGLTAYPDDALIVAIQGDGKIVVAGGAGVDSPNERFALVRYEADGSLDPSFGGDGEVTTDFSPYPDVVFALALQADGKIVAAGGARLGRPNPIWALARYETDGSLDPSFDADGKVTTDFTPGDDDVYSLALQADGKIVAGGQAGLFHANFALARYHLDGSLDTSFGGDGKLTTSFTHGYDSVYNVAIQADGKIVAAGTARFAKFALARYLP